MKWRDGWLRALLIDLISRFGLAILWLLHFLPLSLLAAIGNGTGIILFYLVVGRRKVALRNLQLCFPEQSQSERQALAKKHFQAAARGYLERGILWWSSATRLTRLVSVSGREHITEHIEAHRAIIFLVPHFVGLDMGGSRITLLMDMVSVYARQGSPLIDKYLHRGRTRFGDVVLVARDAGIRPVIKYIRAGRGFYYLPDMDNGAKDSEFVPFFGVAAATISGLPRLAKATGALIVPLATRMLPGGQGYRLELGKPYNDYPGDDLFADLKRMNETIEEMVLSMPEQYYWVHRRFKTTPPGETYRY